MAVSLMPKTNKYAFLGWAKTDDAQQDLEDIAEIMEWLTSHHFAAVISPLHNRDHWTKTDIKKRIKRLNEVYPYANIQYGDECWERRTGKYHMGPSGRVYDTEPVNLPCVGEPKKPHRHYYLKFDYSIPATQLINYFEENESPIRVAYFEPILSERAYLRYFAHLDNKEKAQYSVNDIINLGGVDIRPCYEMTRADQVANFKGLRDYIYKHPKIGSIRGLIRSLDADGLTDYAMQVQASTYFWSQMLNPYADGKVQGTNVRR